VKAFAYLTVVVLVVIGIGVSLVGGLRSTSYSLQGLPSATYALGGARFSITFPGSLRPARLRTGQVAVTPCVVDEFGTGDDDQLVLNVVVFERNGNCDASTVIHLASRCYHGPSSLYPGIQFGAWGEICAAGKLVRRPSYDIVLAVESGEGPTAAHDVVDSFRILGLARS
jgi:hypothetical protein